MSRWAVSVTNNGNGRLRRSEPFVEMNPTDASRLGVKSGDLLAVESDRVPTQEETISNGSFTAVAYVTDEVPQGAIFSMFHYPGSPANAVVVADAASQPINPRQPFKFGCRTVTHIGETSFADAMPFAPRNLV